MTDWIEIGIGVALMLPMIVLLYYGAWCRAQDRGMSFSEFVKRVLTIAVNLMLFSVVISMTVRGFLMILEAFR
jgi:hypothetical protein